MVFIFVAPFQEDFPDSGRQIDRTTDGPDSPENKTDPKAERDLLIAAPSFKRSPVAPVESALSEPAKSTKFMTLDGYKHFHPHLT